MKYYLLVTVAVFLNVYAQLIFKWRLSGTDGLPADHMEKLKFLVGVFMNFWVITGVASVFLASILWMAALTKLPLSLAYPLMGLSFVTITFATAYLFNEQLTTVKVIGSFVIMAGIAITYSRS